MRLMFFLSLIFAIIALQASDYGFDRETLLIKPYLSDSSSCLSCHSEADKSLLQDTARSCDARCITCHKDITGTHHPIGIRNKRSVGDLELTKFGRIGCRTCHDLHNKRFDDESWKSETLYQRIFNRQEKYKTYFLRIKNTNGELCRKCHY